eukprot:scaffold67557_cov18-Tisochrysis_lutea.AAC.2
MERAERGHMHEQRMQVCRPAPQHRAIAAEGIWLQQGSFVWLQYKETAGEACSFLAAAVPGAAL